MFEITGKMKGQWITPQSFMLREITRGREGGQLPAVLPLARNGKHRDKQPTGGHVQIR